MIQAALSGKQNIIEGSMASGISKEAEKKLSGVARAGLVEMRADFRDFLRTRNLEKWPKDHPYAKRFWDQNRQPDANPETFRKGNESDDSAISGKVIIGLIRVTCYHLDRHLRKINLKPAVGGIRRERLCRISLLLLAKWSGHSRYCPNQKG